MADLAQALLTHPSPASIVQPRFLEYFRLFGRVLGKAFIEDVPLSLRLSKLLLKQLLEIEDGALADLEHFDADVFKSLCWMLDNDITGVLDETFSADISVLGATETVDLKPGGRDIAVTEENKQEFVELKARVVMLHGIKEQPVLISVTVRLFLRPGRAGDGVLAMARGRGRWRAGDGAMVEGDAIFGVVVLHHTWELITCTLVTRVEPNQSNLPNI
jgi:hypothetical protein